MAKAILILVFSLTVVTFTVEARSDKLIRNPLLALFETGSDFLDSLHGADEALRGIKSKELPDLEKQADLLSRKLWREYEDLFDSGLGYWDETFSFFDDIDRWLKGFLGTLTEKFPAGSATGVAHHLENCQKKLQLLKSKFGEVRKLGMFTGDEAGNAARTGLWGKPWDSGDKWIREVYLLNK